MTLRYKVISSPLLAKTSLNYRERLKVLSINQY